MLKFSKIFVFALSLLTFLVFSQFAYAQNGMKTFNENGMSFNYPSSYEEVRGLPQPVLMLLKLPDAGNNVSFACQNLPYQMPLQEFVKVNVDNILSTFKFNVDSKKNMTVGGYPAIAVQFSGNIAGNSITQEQIYVVVGDKAYLVTLTAFGNTFSQAKTQSYKIINTIKFSK